MQRMIWAVLVAFLAALLIGPALHQALRRRKFGQNVYELAPAAHKKKQGVPTMGGLLIALSTLIAAIALHRGGFSIATDYTFAVLALALGNLCIGLADDLTKIRSGKNGGLTPRQKLIFQTLLAIAFSLYCYFHPQIGPVVIVPFVGWEWNLGIFYIPIMVVAIVFMTNSANLLDGLDGLLSSVSMVDGAALGLIALFMSVSATDAGATNLQNLAVTMCALAGACMGFLRFNGYPAKWILGDTGSMFIGGAVVGAALAMRQPILLLLVAVCMVISSLSVIIQRVYFDATHGKRIFKMSPLHHHFELSGVPEPKIVSMYMVASVAACLLALLAVMPR